MAVLQRGTDGDDGRGRPVATGVGVRLVRGPAGARTHDPERARGGPQPLVASEQKVRRGLPALRPVRALRVAKGWFRDSFPLALREINTGGPSARGPRLVELPSKLTLETVRAAGGRGGFVVIDDYGAPGKAPTRPPTIPVGARDHRPAGRGRPDGGVLAQASDRLTGTPPSTARPALAPEHREGLGWRSSTIAAAAAARPPVAQITSAEGELPSAGGKARAGPFRSDRRGRSAWHYPPRDGSRAARSI